MNTARTRLLLLLEERPRHGYELAAELARSNGPTVPLGSVYQHLRALTQAGSVSSHLDFPAAGPARRVYELSPVGHALLRHLCTSSGRPRS